MNGYVHASSRGPVAFAVFDTIEEARAAYRAYGKTVPLIINTDEGPFETLRVPKTDVQIMSIEEFEAIGG